MTPQDHNKSIVLIYSFFGLALAVTGIVLLVRDLKQKDWALALYKDALFIASTVLSIYLLTTVYGMVRRRRWGRVMALVTAAFFIWFFPVGTLLGVYIWWFLHSDGAKQLYSRSSS